MSAKISSHLIESFFVLVRSAEPLEVSKAPEQASGWILFAQPLVQRVPVDIPRPNPSHSLTMGAASQSEASERTLVKQGGRRASMLEILGLKGNFSHLNLKDPFNVKKLGSSYTTEIRAGLTTFLAMAYILPVNSGMLSLAVPDMKEQLVCATALAAFIGCWLMGILSNFPFMLAPGMGTNAYFTFSIVLGRGLPWQAAFAAVFVAGCLFTLLSVTGIYWHAHAADPALPRRHQGDHRCRRRALPDLHRFPECRGHGVLCGRSRHAGEARVPELRLL